MNKIRLYQVILIGIIAGEIIYLVLAATGLAASDPAPGNDFWQHLYAAKAIRAGSTKLAPNGADFIYPYPAFVAIVLMPLSFLPSSVALLVWLLILYSVLGGSAYYCARNLLNLQREHRFSIFLGALAWPVSFVAIFLGQISPLILGLLLLSLYLASIKEDLAAGLILAFTLAKPHLAWMIPLGLLLKGKKRCFGGFLLGAIPLLTISAWLGKSNQLSGWKAYVSGWFLNNERSLSLIGRLYLLPPAVQLALSLFGAILIAAWWLRRSKIVLIDVGKGFLLSLLVSPYVLISDLVLVMPIFIVLSTKRRLIFWFSLVLMSVSVLRFGLGDFVAVSLILLAVSSWQYEIPSRATVATN